MEFKVLITGSDGNSSFLKFKDTIILIDAGFKTKKKMEEMVLPILKKYGKIDGVIITHNHSDHLSNWTGRMCIEYNIPIFLHSQHLEENKKNVLIYEDNKLGQTFYAKYHFIEENKAFDIKDITILPFLLFHDSPKTLGFIFNSDFGYIADCGFISNQIKNILKNVSSIALEFNYDTEKLLNSPRHFINKLRIFGKYGHLSNQEAINFSKYLIKNGKLKKIITLHTSGEHNDLNIIESELKKLEIEFFISEKENNKKVFLI